MSGGSRNEASRGRAWGIAGQKRRSLVAWVLAAASLAATFLPQTGAADQHDGFESSAGQLLVATRSMPDSRFARTVIYMVRHDETGAMGLVVNRPMGEVPLASLLEGLGVDADDAEGTIRIHYGGPVEYTQGFVLHSPDYVVEGTLVVDGGLALTAKADIVRDIATGEGPRQSLVVFGYAGWSPGQLEAEMARDDWITVPADEALVFDDEYEDKWRRAMARRSIDL